MIEKINEVSPVMNDGDLTLELAGFRMAFSLRYFKDGAWLALEHLGGNQWGAATEPGLKVGLELEPGSDGWQYELAWSRNSRRRFACGRRWRMKRICST